VTGEPVHSQPGTGVRFDWGLAGAAEFARTCAALVVVEVLSFTTEVDVAVAAGSRVHPFPWPDQAREYADRIGGAVAPARAGVADLVLPAPHGAAIVAAAASTGRPVLAACLRNARAVGAWLVAEGFGSVARPVGVIAAGKRWPDGTLRPCAADLLGAAAVVDALSKGDSLLSVEAAVTLAAYGAIPDVTAAVQGTVTARALESQGKAEAVRQAAELQASRATPLYRAGAFTAA
jgi:2-phosphosulfolactate phosphatase